MLINKFISIIENRVPFDNPRTNPSIKTKTTKMMVPADSKAAASGPLTERVRSSCAALVAHEGSAVRVNADKVRAFTDALNWSEFESLAKPDRFPLNFRSRQDEINFLGEAHHLYLSLTL
jgi:hypothetical protein